MHTIYQKSNLLNPTNKNGQVSCCDVGDCWTNNCPPSLKM